MRPGVRGVGSPQVAALGDRLPGVAAALDPRAAAASLRAVAGALVDSGEISVQKVWLREDGACDVRYSVRPRAEAGNGLEDAVVLLGRVHHDPASAAGYVADANGMAAIAGHAEPVSGSTVLPGGGVLALSPFPFDPRLPGLPSATDPTVLGQHEPFAGLPEPPAVTVVQHSRDGACVLRFDGRPRAEAGPATAWYGKVYPDTSGEVVDGFLRALPGSGLLAAAGGDGEQHARFPRPVNYDPTLRLLVTEALPGRPRVRELLRAFSRGTSHASAGGSADLLQAVRTSARALAALHGSDLATAPVHSVRDELSRLERELDIVGSVWPREAVRVADAVDAVAGAVEQPDDLVLSHGDFTPSQVLLRGGTPGVVDLDTLCWADPALDLGRYLAHVRLLLAKAGGPDSPAHAADLDSAFLDGYAAVGPRTRTAARAADRISLYVTTTLARSALHSCRQLKTDRFELAMSLLEGTHTRRNQL